MNPIVSNGNMLRFKFDKIKELNKDGMKSVKFSFSGVDWKIYICTEPAKQKKFLGFYLYYVGANKTHKNWLLELDGQMRLLAQGEIGKHKTRRLNDCYYEGKSEWGFGDFIDWGEVMSQNSGYLKEDSIVVEIEFDFKYYDFSKNIPNYTDIVISIGNTDFHLNRWLLAVHSTHFSHMFFNRKIGESHVKITDITPLNFCFLLASLNPYFVPDFDPVYPELIKLAEKYGVPALHYKIEQFLIAYPNDYQLIERFKMADAQKYEMLMKSCLQSLDTVGKIRSLQAMVEYPNLSEATKMRVMNRLTEIL